MKLIINQKILTDILAKIQGITSRTTPLPITKNVLIKINRPTDDNESTPATTATFTATDLEIGYHGTCEICEGSEPGQVALSAKKLLDIVKGMPGPEITIEQMENRWVRIDSIAGRTIEFKIVGANPDDFPDPKNFPEKALPAVIIKTADLAPMLRQAMCVQGDNDDNPPHIKGALFEFEKDTTGVLKDRLLIVSLDGYRLIITEKEPHLTVSDPSFRVIVPKKGLKDLIKMMPAESRDIELIVWENTLHCILENGNGDYEELSIRLLEGEFPDYNQIAGKLYAGQMDTDRENFANTLKRMSILSSEEYKSATIKLSKNNLKITTTNPEIGESREEFPVNFTYHSEAEICINPKLLADLVNIMDTERLLVKITDDHTKDALCLQPKTEDPDTPTTFTAYIMPMRP